MVQPSELELVAWLQKTHLFQGIAPPQLKLLAAIAQPQTFAKGELIFRQGEAATGFFVIHQGRVKIFKLSSQGKEQIIRIFGAGENFAEVAALDGQPFPASAAALERVELLFFPNCHFLELMTHQADLAVNMLVGLSRHLRHLSQVIEDLSFRDVPQRLASYLLDLPPTQPSVPHVVILNLTKGQLAAQLGTIPSTLSRAFDRLSKQGLIAVAGAQVTLCDRDRLASLRQVAIADEETPDP